jgi:tetratricopeptide (TPR) repeat protein
MIPNPFFIRVATASLLLLVLGIGPSCSKRQAETTPLPDGIESAFAAATGDIGDARSIPEYANAKKAMRLGKWKQAQRQLETLLERYPDQAIFANDLGFVELQLEQLPQALRAFDEAISIDGDYERAHFNRGICLSAMQQNRAARAAYQKALQINPFYYEAAFNLGLLAFKEEDWDTARSAFASIVDNTRSKAFASAHYHLGLIAARLGQLADAVQYYEDCLLLDPSHLASYINLGATLLKLNLPDVAEKWLLIAKGLYPSETSLNWNLALAYAQTGHEQKAEAILREIINQDADYTPAYINLATHLMSRNEWVEAKGLLQIAARQQPDNPAIYWNLGRIADNTEKPDEAVEAYRTVVDLEPRRTEAYLNLSAALMRKGYLEEARHPLEQGRTLDPQDPRVWWNMGLMEVRLGNDASSIEYFLTVLRLEPGNTNASLNLCAALMRLEKWQEAVDVALPIVQKGVGDQRHAWNLALCYNALERTDLEIEALLDVLDTDPNHIEAAFNLGLIYFKRDQLNTAKEAFYRAAFPKSGTGSAKAHYMLGKIFSAEGNVNAAINAYETALSLQPDYPEATFNLALNLQKAGEDAAAIRLYQELESLDRATPEALNNLALHYIRIEVYEKAISLLQKATSLAPGYETAWYNLGLAFMRQGNDASAQAAFLGAVEADPEYFAAWKNLGIAHSRQNDVLGALTAMQKAFELNPSDGDCATYIVKYLKQLDRSESEVTSIYQTAFDNGVRHPLLLRHLAKVASGEDDAAAVLYYREYLKIRPTAPYFYNLGLALRRLGRFAEARDAYDQAVTLDPEFEKAWLNLGYVRAFLQDRAGAQAAFEKALSINPDYDNARTALEDLRNNKIHP